MDTTKQQFVVFYLDGLSWYWTPRSCQQPVQC